MKITALLSWLWLGFCCLCYGAVWVSPAVFWPAAFVAMLGIPFAIVGSGIGLVLLLFSGPERKYWRPWALGIIFSGPFLLSSIGLQKQEPSIKDSKQVKLVSFNMGKKLEGEDKARFMRKKYLMGKANAWLISQKPDVLFLQEAFNYQPVTEFQLVRKLRAAGYYTYFIHHTNHAERDGAGMAIASQTPFLHKAIIWGPPGSLNMIHEADITLQGQPVRLINVHLQSIRISLGEMEANQPWRKLFANSISIIRKMRKAYISRAAQVKALEQAIEASPHPVLVGGDFNDTPYSYTYWRMRRHLPGSFEQGAWGVWGTYNGAGIGKLLRIDHQFSAAPLMCTRLIKVDSIPYSDHFPLLGTYMLTKP